MKLAILPESKHPLLYSVGTKASTLSACEKFELLCVDKEVWYPEKEWYYSYRKIEGWYLKEKYDTDTTKKYDTATKKSIIICFKKEVLHPFQNVGRLTFFTLSFTTRLIQKFVSNIIFFIVACFIIKSSLRMT